MVLERQLRLDGHVARYPDDAPDQQNLLAREPREWRGPLGLTTFLVVAAG